MAQPAKYKFYLGKEPNTSVNIINNGTFTGSLTGWTTYNSAYTGATAWNYVSNTAECYGAPSPADPLMNIMRQVNVLQVGETYDLYYDLKRATTMSGTGITAYVNVSFGGDYIDFYNADITGSTTFVPQQRLKQFCGFGTDLMFYCPSYSSPCAIDNVVVYKYEWNTPLTYEPVNWEDSKIAKKRDKIINGLVVEYISNLTFINDGYEYLYNKIITGGTCSDVDIKIEVYNPSTGLYDLYHEGIISLVDCKFNTTKKQVDVNIEDSGNTQLLLKTKKTKVSIIDDKNIIYTAGYYQLKTAPNTLKGINITDATGAIYNTQQAALVYNVLKRIILKSTNYMLDFDSPFFNSGTFQYLYLTNGEFALSGRSIDSELSKLSFEELFIELNKLFNLSFNIDKSGALPKLIINTKLSYYSATPILSLNYVNDVEFEVDKDSLYKNIYIGYEFADNLSTTNDGDTPEGIQYTTDNQCADGDLNLVSKYIQSSPVIQSLTASAMPSDKYDKKRVWLETDNTTTINSGAPNYYLNYNIDDIDNAGRHIDTLNTSYYRANDNSTAGSVGLETITKSNASYPLIYTFKYPLTKAQFDLIEQAYNTIEFDTDGTPATRKTGFVLEASYDIKTGLTDFKLLSS